MKFVNEILGGIFTFTKRHFLTNFVFFYKKRHIKNVFLGKFLQKQTAKKATKKAIKKQQGVYMSFKTVEIIIMSMHCKARMR